MYSLRLNSEGYSLRFNFHWTIFVFLSKSWNVSRIHTHCSCKAHSLHYQYIRVIFTFKLRLMLVTPIVNSEKLQINYLFLFPVLCTIYNVSSSLWTSLEESRNCASESKNKQITLFSSKNKLAVANVLCWPWLIFISTWRSGALRFLLVLSFISSLKIQIN